MMNLVPAVVVLVFASSAHAGPPADAPRLVAASPANGARVSPGPALIRWTFDRPMMPGSWSVTGRPADMPELVGAPSYSPDGRTFMQRVRLAPGRSYDLGVNSQSYRGFRSAAGVPVVPVRVRFSTMPERPAKLDR